MKEEFKTKLYNYYGRVGFRKENEKYTMFLDNWDGESEIEVSKKMYDEAKELTLTNKE